MGRKDKKVSDYTIADLGQRVNRRPGRVAEVIRNELSMLLLRETRDPRLRAVTLSRVEVSPDLRAAVIYFNCQKSEVKDVLSGLTSARGFMRSTLAQRISLRYMPKLVFKHDLAAMYQAEMDQVFREIANEHPQDE